MVTIMDHYEERRTEEIVEDPMDIPRRMMESWVPQLVDELPDVFNGKIRLMLSYVARLYFLKNSNSVLW